MQRFVPTHTHNHTRTHSHASFNPDKCYLLDDSYSYSYSYSCSYSYFFQPWLISHRNLLILMQQFAFAQSYWIIIAHGEQLLVWSQGAFSWIVQKQMKDNNKSKGEHLNTSILCAMLMTTTCNWFQQNWTTMPHLWCVSIGGGLGW